MERDNNKKIKYIFREVNSNRQRNKGRLFFSFYISNHVFLRLTELVCAFEISVALLQRPDER